MTRLVPRNHREKVAIPKSQLFLAIRNADGDLSAHQDIGPGQEANLSVEVTTAELPNLEAELGGLLERKTISRVFTLETSIAGRAEHIMALWGMGNWEDVTVSATPVTGEISGYVGVGAAIFLGMNSVARIPAKDVSSVTVAVEAPAARANTTAYAFGAIVEPATPNGNWYMNVAPSGGTSGASAPTFPTDGSTVTDGTVTWRDMGTKTYSATTDYDLFAAEGTVMIPESGAIFTAISRVPAALRNAGKTFRLSLGYTQAARTQRVLKSNRTEDYEGDLIIKSAGVGVRDDLHVPKCTVRPTGSLPLKAEDYATLSLTITFVDASEEDKLRWFRQA